MNETLSKFLDEYSNEIMNNFDIWDYEKTDKEMIEYAEKNNLKIVEKSKNGYLFEDK